MRASWFEHYAPGVPRTAQVPDGPVYGLLEESAARFPTAPALEFYGLTLTYVQLADAVNRLAAALRGIGVMPGERVALMLPNLPQMVIGFFAVNKLGAVIVNVNPLYTAPELAHQLTDAEAETLIVLDRFFPVYRRVAAALPVKRVIVTGIQDYLPFPKSALFPLLARRKGEWVEVKPGPGVFSFKDLLAHPGPDLEPTSVRGGDVVLLQYTGGTTGTPRGAMLTNRNLLTNIAQVKAWMPYLREGREGFLLVIPLFHVYGMTAGMGLAVATASKMILLPRFDVKAVLRTIHKQRPGLVPGVPTMYLAMNNHPQVSRYDLSSVHTCISGAAALPLEVKRRFEALTGARLVEGYGLTEASPVTHCNPVGGEWREGSIGLPLPGVEMKIVGDRGNELPPGETGELCVKGPNVMAGYWRCPEETAEVLPDGWLRTGDMARVDEDGYAYILDRKKDMIDASGFNVYPREIEEVLYAHPAVLEAAVVGVPDAYRGETVKAFIVLKPGLAATAEELVSFCKERLAPYKVPKQLEFLEALPKSLVGKVLRRELAVQPSNSSDSGVSKSSIR